MDFDIDKSLLLIFAFDHFISIFGAYNPPYSQKFPDYYQTFQYITVIAEL